MLQVCKSQKGIIFVVIIIIMGASEKRAFSELQLTGLRLARRKQEGGPALCAFMFIVKVIIMTRVIFKRLNPGAAEDGAEDVLVVRRHLPAAEPTQRLPLK